jgi:hypothetical protein
LIELVVVLTIVAILASLTLGGLAVTRQRARIDKTKSTIRKIHELIVPHYESYLRRRVPLPTGLTSGATIAQDRLVGTRALTLFEMPDSWEDVAISGITTTGTLPSALTVPVFAWNGVTRAYAEYQRAMLLTSGPGFRSRFPSSECLYMIVSRGLGEPDVMEQFRADEIGDVDGDGAPEFIDGWGQPIAFIRWPVGFDSPIQFRNAALQPDPFDPFRVSTAVAYPSASQQDYAATPLIFSGGPDGASSKYGISTGTVIWHTLFVTPNSTFSTPQYTLRVEHASPLKIAGARDDPTVAADNVTNHDLFAK